MSDLRGLDHSLRLRSGRTVSGRCGALVEAGLHSDDIDLVQNYYYYPSILFCTHSAEFGDFRRTIEAAAGWRAP